MVFSVVIELLIFTREGGVTRGVTAHIYTQLKGILQPKLS
jgi:hypothetical protein